jgi:hypothetical protein
LVYGVTLGPGTGERQILHNLHLSDLSFPFDRAFLQM